MAKPQKYKVTYQTRHVDHDRTKIIFATSEHQALIKFRAYIAEHNMMVSEMDINRE